MAIEKVIDVKIQSEGAETAVKSLKTQLREAQNEVNELSNKFGATSKEAVEAAKRASQLKDQIGDAKALTDAFNPDAKFKSLTSSLSGVAGGFSAVQGAMGLMGAESENVEKTLLKVQSAMALSTGLQQLGESADAFKQLKAVALNALNGIKTAIGSTGIGLLVVALGAVYAYWDDIKEAVTGVSEEQKQLNSLSQANFDAEKGKLEALGSQDNILKLQGKSEKDILKMKIAQTNETIKDGEINLENLIASNKMAFEAETRNKNILQRLMRFGIEMSLIPIRALLAPLDLIITTANKVADVLGFEKITSLNIQDEITKLSKFGSDKLSSFVFDPKKTQEQGDKAVEEQKKYLAKIKNDRAGYQNQVNAIDKKASDDAQAKADEKAKKAEEEKQKELDELQKQKDALKSIEEKHAKDIEDLNAKTDREKLELQAERDMAELDAVKLSEEEKQKARQEIIDKYRILGKELDAKEAEEKTTKDLENKQKEFEDETLSFEERRQLLDEQSKIIDEGFFKSEEERTNSKKANTKAREVLDKAEQDSKIATLDAVSSAMSSASELAGKETAVGKTLAVASATIATYTNAVKAYQAGLSVGGPAGLVLAPISAGLAVAAGLMNIKKILSVQVPGKSGGGSSSSAPSISAGGGGGGAMSAPQFNVVGNSGTNQLASSLGSAIQSNPVQAYVVASNVTTAQSLNRNIVQNATLG